MDSGLAKTLLLPRDLYDYDYLGGNCAGLRWHGKLKKGALRFVTTRLLHSKPFVP